MCVVWGGVTATASLSQTSYNDDATLNSLFQQAVNAKSNNQVFLTLPAEDFFLRGRFGVFPSSHPGLTTADSVTIQGAVNPNGVKQTRIIAGIPAPEAFWGNIRRAGQAASSRDLPSTDPWHFWLSQSEAASGREIYWIDLDHFATASNDGTDSPLTYSGTRAWENQRDQVWFWRFLRGQGSPESIPDPLTATSFSGNSYQSLMTMTMNGIPMRMAELADVFNKTVNQEVVPDYTGTGYTRSLYVASPTTLGLNVNETLRRDDNSTVGLPSSINLAKTTDMLCTVFHGNDYQPVTVPVAGVRGIYIHDEEELDKIVGVARYEIDLALNPFLSGVPKKDDLVVDFTRSQRFKLLNSPQFLRRPGTFILRTTGPSEKWNKMIFFIPAEEESDEEYAIRQAESSGALPAGPPPPGTVPPVGSRRLEISCPKYEQDDTINAVPIAFGTQKTGVDPNAVFSPLAGVTVKNLIFSSGVGTGLRIDKTNNVSIQGNYFRNFGSTNLTLVGVRNLLLGDEAPSLGNIFRGGYKGMVSISPYLWWYSKQVWNPQTQAYETKWFEKSLERTDFKINPPNGFPTSTAIPSDFASLVGPEYSIRNNLFERTGTHFPEIAAFQCNGYLIGAEFEDNTFRQVAGAAINFGGMRNTIFGNLFEDCVMHQTDAGAIYLSRSFAQVGNRIVNNDFRNIRNRTPYLQGGTVPYLTDEVNGVMLDDTTFGTVVKYNRFGFAPATQFWDHKRGVKSNGGAFCVFRDNADIDNKYAVALHKINVDNPQTLSQNGLDVRYQHYRELGEIMKSSGVLVNGVLNAAWQSVFQSVANESTDIGGDTEPLKSRRFTKEIMVDWFEDLLASSAYNSPIWPQTTPSTPWAALAAAPTTVNPLGNPFFSVVNGQNKIQNLHMVCDGDVDR